MGFDRRMLGLLVLLGIVGIPALALRLLCVGHACDEPVAVSADIPFCSLPASVRGPLAAGFREDRSPDVLAVTGGVTVAGGHTFSRGPQPQWPAIEPLSRRVPLAVFGGAAGGTIPEGTGLDDVAPTVASLMGIERPHPEVRSGRPIATLEAERPAPLVVLVAWKGVGSAELEARPESWRRLADLGATGAMDLEVVSPSLPLEPTASLATIGAGGTPAQHGITGSHVRTDEGELAEAWTADAPVSVISALGDDLDEVTNQQARVGLIADSHTDRGLIGGNWYVDTDRDDVIIERDPDRVIDHVRRLLSGGYIVGFGGDEAPDLLGVTLDARLRQMDKVTHQIAAAVQERVEDAVVVVTSTGSSIRNADLHAGRVADHVDRSLDAVVVEGISPGGLYLDQQMLADLAIPEDRVLDALSDMEHANAGPVFDDVFPAIAVSFGRYC